MRDYWTAAQRLVGSLAACEAFLSGVHFYLLIFIHQFTNLMCFRLTVFLTKDFARPSFLTIKQISL